MPSAGSVSVPSKSTSSALRRLDSGLGAPALCDAWAVESAISEGGLGGKGPTR